MAISFVLACYITHAHTHNAVCVDTTRLIGWLFISKLRKVVTATENAVTQKEKLAVRKTTLIALTSICSTLLLNLTDALIINHRIVRLLNLDVVLNCLFIASYFEFGRDLYSVVFCICERNANQIDRCLFNGLDQKQVDSVMLNAHVRERESGSANDSGVDKHSEIEAVKSTSRCE